MQAGAGLLILDVMPIYRSLSGYHHDYLKFYQLPNSNLFTHHLLFFSREATSETYGPRVSSLIYLLSRSVLLFALFLICNYYFQIYISKNPKIPCCTLFYSRSIYLIYHIFITSVCQFLVPLPER